MHGDDGLIDSVAREMTEGEPSPGLRPAIRAQIAGRPVRAHHAGYFGVWMPALAAAVAVVVAVFIGQALLQPVEPPVVPQIAASRPEPLAIPNAASAVNAPNIPVGRSDPKVVKQAKASLTPLAVSEPLVVEPLSVPLMAVSTSSGVMPIDVQPLQIDPLQSE